MKALKLERRLKAKREKWKKAGEDMVAALKKDIFFR